MRDDGQIECHDVGINQVRPVCLDVLKCGQPQSSPTSETPLTSDSLVILQAAVGLNNVCGGSICVCDVDSTGFINVTDALLTLKAAVGQSIVLNCSC